MSEPGTFFGIGVGPGEPGLLPLLAWDALQSCEVIYAPRAKSSAESVARRCLHGLEIPAGRIREIEFTMSSHRDTLRAHYRKVAQMIAAELQASRNVAYLTIGDPFTYSTYGYALQALLGIMPGVKHRTFPGITSYAATSAALGFPLGEGRERILITPCPDEMEELREDILGHDIVVLMKISERLLPVIDLLRQMRILEHCALASRVGMPEQQLFPDLQAAEPEESLGYLSVMLIRKEPREVRYR